MRVLTLCCLAGAICCAEPVSFEAPRRAFEFPSVAFFPSQDRSCRPVVAASDFDGDGRIDLMVGELMHNTERGFRLAGLLGSGDATFTPNGPLRDFTGSALPAVAAADFDGDGIVDVAIADGPSVIMAWGIGDGSFRETYLERPPMPVLDVTLVEADINGDTKPDLVLLNEGNETITVFLNTGSRLFGRVTTTGAPTHPFSLAVGHFDHDGNLDLAISHGGSTFPNWGPGSPGSGISIYMGEGDGTFRQAPEIAQGAAILSAVAGDFDGDANLDLAVPAVAEGHAAVLVFAGLGNGGFRPLAGPQAVPVCLVSADFDNDGKNDLLSLDLRPEAHFFRNNGDGILAAPVTYHGGSTNIGVVKGDWNSDGAVDVALLDSDSTSANILVNDGRGAFIGPPEYSACCSSQKEHAVVTGDVDGDGLPEVLYKSYSPDNLAVLHLTPDRTLSEIKSFQLNGFFSYGPPVIGDFNGDRINDIAAFAENGALAILLGRDHSSPILLPSLFVGVGAGILTRADLNSDGVDDLILTRQNAAVLTTVVDILLGKGDGTFYPPGHLTLELASGLHSVVAGDFNGDSRTDLVIGTYLSFEHPPVLLFLSGNGDATFAQAITIEGFTAVSSVAAADLNGDGILDMMVADSLRGLVLLAGNGDGTFRSFATLADGAGGWRTRGGYKPFWLGDINCDGVTDLAYRAYRSVAVQFGNTEGNFSPISRFNANDNQSFSVSDLNGDGKPDIVIAQDAAVSVLWNITAAPQTPAPLDTKSRLAAALGK